MPGQTAESVWFMQGASQIFPEDEGKGLVWVMLSAGRTNKTTPPLRYFLDNEKLSSVSPGRPTVHGHLTNEIAEPGSRCMILARWELDAGRRGSRTLSSLSLSYSRQPHRTQCLTL